MRRHLNRHSVGELGGAIPAAFLTEHSLTICTVCSRTLHTRFHGTCPRCQPAARAAASAARADQSPGSSE
eukprot:12178714-Karenia_brevis.AAC.1